MRRIARYVLAFGLLRITTVLAADLPSKIMPVVRQTPAYNWTGFYFGGHLGGGWARTRYSGSDPLGQETGSDLGSQNAIGLLAGGQIGLNYQMGRWLVG